VLVWHSSPLCIDDFQVRFLGPGGYASSLQQRVDIFQVERVETFGERLVDRQEEVKRLRRAALMILRALAGDLGRRRAGEALDPLNRMRPDPSSGAILSRYDIAI
jgi:hypothetical protein